MPCGPDSDDAAAGPGSTARSQPINAPLKVRERAPPRPPILDDTADRSRDQTHNPFILKVHFKTLAAGRLTARSHHRLKTATASSQVDDRHAAVRDDAREAEPAAVRGTARRRARSRRSTLRITARASLAQ